MRWFWYYWDFSIGTTSRENVEEKGRSNLFSLSKTKYFCEAGFSICTIAFPKKGRFFDFVLNFLLLCSSKGLKTPFFRIYVHFCVLWYIVCLYKLEIKALRIFSQKSWCCPRKLPSFLEPCRKYFLSVLVKLSKLDFSVIYEGNFFHSSGPAKIMKFLRDSSL